MVAARSLRTQFTGVELLGYFRLSKHLLPASPVSTAPSAGMDPPSFDLGERISMSGTPRRWTFTRADLPPVLVGATAVLAGFVFTIVTRDTAVHGFVANALLSIGVATALVGLVLRLQLDIQDELDEAKQARLRFEAAMRREIEVIDRRLEEVLSSAARDRPRRREIDDLYGELDAARDRVRRLERELAAARAAPQPRRRGLLRGRRRRGTARRVSGDLAAAWTLAIVRARHRSTAAQERIAGLRLVAWIRGLRRVVSAENLLLVVIWTALWALLTGLFLGAVFLAERYLPWGMTRVIADRTLGYELATAILCAVYAAIIARDVRARLGIFVVLLVGGQTLGWLLGLFLS
jgi:hypothetical protein